MLATLVVMISTAVAVIFAASTVGKLRAFGAFRSSVAKFVPTRLVGLVAVAVVAAEGVLATGLVVAELSGQPGARAAALVGAAALLVCFTVVIAKALRQGGRVTCRCFGAESAPIGARHIGRNLLLALAAAGASAGALARPESPPPAWYAVAAGAGLLLAGLSTQLDALVELFAAPRPPAERGAADRHA